MKPGKKRILHGLQGMAAAFLTLTLVLTMALKPGAATHDEAKEFVLAGPTSLVEVQHEAFTAHASEQVEVVDVEVEPTSEYDVIEEDSTETPIEKIPILDRTQPIYEVFKNGFRVEVPVDLQWRIRDLAYEHGYCERIIFGMILAESTFRPHAMGDQGRSWGLAQINRFWITRANVPLSYRLTEDWRERDLLNPEHNLLTLMEIWNFAVNRYDLDMDDDLHVKRLLFWHNTGNDPRRVRNWPYSNRIFGFAEELVLIEQYIYVYEDQLS